MSRSTASLRVDLTAEFSESVDTLERVVRFARAMEELGLEVRITGDVGVLVEAAVQSETPQPTLELDSEDEAVEATLRAFGHRR